jgi:hypothetical protein
MKMRTVSDIIELWPRALDLALDLGISPPRISDWKNRNSIPAAYWRDLIRAARKRGISEVTAELLVDFHARDAGTGASGFGEEERAFESPATLPPSVGQPLGTGHFSRFKHHRRDNFRTAQEIEEHIGALRDEWSHR